MVVMQILKFHKVEARSFHGIFRFPGYFLFLMAEEKAAQFAVFGNAITAYLREWRRIWPREANGTERPGV